ncbi:MAG: hypothetical protein AB9879_02625 [Methanothrix sp.]
MQAMAPWKQIMENQTGGTKSIESNPGNHIPHESIDAIKSWDQDDRMAGRLKDTGNFF